MSWDFTHGSGRVAAVEVRTATQDRPGSKSSGEVVGVMDRADPMGMAIIAVDSRFMGAEAEAAGK